MTKRSKVLAARLAAQLAALQFGVDQRKARKMILFWFDSEEMRPDASIETLAAAVRDAMAGDPTGKSSPRGASVAARGSFSD